MSDAEFILAEIDRRRRKSWVSRSVLAALSIVQLALALPWLFGNPGLWPEGGASAAHLTRDGALGVMYALAGLAVAQSTKRAWFALPLVFVVTCIQTFFGFFDHHNDQAFASFEVVHLLGIVIAVGIAYFVQPASRPRRRTQLRVVDQ
jgi:hypothetical protein